MRLIDVEKFAYAAIGFEKDGIEYWEKSCILDSLNDEDANPTIDPVHAAGGCYCRECRMRQGVETKETVLCGYHGCSMRKDDFCSMGKREENDG